MKKATKKPASAAAPAKAAAPAGSIDWKQYIDATKDNPPRPLLLEALKFVETKGAALDLGAGALNDSKHLISQGFHSVTAVDMDPASAEKASELSLGSFTFIQSAFADFDFPVEAYDLVNAQYALPFNPPETFNIVLEKIIASLKPGGVFVGQFFGNRSGSNTKGSGKTFHTLEEAKKLLSRLYIKDFKEEEEDKKLDDGTVKRWHVFHFIAIR